jgi:hypothetical protein
MSGTYRPARLSAAAAGDARAALVARGARPLSRHAFADLRVGALARAFALRAALLAPPRQPAGLGLRLGHPHHLRHGVAADSTPPPRVAGPGSVCVLLVGSEYVQPFGTFSGVLPGGVRLAGGHGVLERHRARW